MSEIKHNEMVAGLAKPGRDIIAEMKPGAMHLLHMAVGISGEASELLEAIDGKHSLDEIDEENITEELGDSEFYLEGYRQETGIKRVDTTCEINIPNYSENYGADFEFSMSIFTKLSMYTGLLLDDTKKMAIYGKPIDMGNVIKHMISIENCLEGIRQVFGILHEETLEHNVKKLGKRYKGHSYSNHQAINRADKHEIHDSEKV